MRRVLAVIPAPTFGGAANQVARLHAPLREAGWELVAAVPTEPGNAGPRLRDAGVEVHETPQHRLRATARPGPHVALARHLRSDVGRLRGLVRHTGADVVINHGDLNPHAGLAGHLEGAAVHWQILDTRTPPALRHVTSPLVTGLADSMSSWGRALAETYPGATALGRRCVTVFPPVVAGELAQARERREAARRELGIPDGALCVGAIGNRNPQKGHEWLMRAAGIARRSRPDLVVRVLGAPSPGHEAHEAGIEDEARRAGLLDVPGGFAMADPGARVPELIGALDVLCMPSVPRSEGMPTVLLEGMVAGLPVVATDVGAVRELVEDGVTGRVVAPLDAEALAQGILEAAGRTAEWGEAGRGRAATTFSLERLRDRYVEAFELAVEHRAARRARQRLV